MARSAKRQRRLDVGEDTEPDAAVLEAAQISDTEASVRLLLQEAERALALPVPFCTKSQVYTIVADRTAVDRELDELAARRRLRVFKLPAKNDFAVVDADRYRAAVEGEAAAAPPECRPLFERFARLALASARTSVGREELARGLELDGADVDPAELEAAVTRLVSAGLLVRESIRTLDSGTFRFCVPQAGGALAAVVKGREELAAVFKRAKFAQRLAKEVERVKLKKRRAACAPPARLTAPRSPLGPRFHVRDMLGSGQLEAAETTRGTLYKLKW